MAEKLKIVFLGTNGWFDTRTGNTTCVLIDAPDAYIILDAGNGIYKADKYIKGDKPVYLFVSHFHLDHIIGLHILNKFKFSQDLDICTYRGGESILKRFMKQPYTVDLSKLPFKVRFRALRPGRNNGFPFGLVCAEMVHSTRCFGFRIEFPEKIISYCTDTGPNDRIIALSAGADLMIAECSWRPGQTSGTWPHLSPNNAAGLAKKAGAKRLVLAHFDADNYRSVEDRVAAQNAARSIFRGARASKDNMVIKI